MRDALICGAQVQTLVSELAVGHPVLFRKRLSPVFLLLFSFLKCMCIFLTEH